MSGFLTNLASRARGTVPQLEPRKPAPYETPVGRASRPEEDIGQSLDMAAPLMVSVPPSKLSPVPSSIPVSAHAPLSATPIGMTTTTPTNPAPSVTRAMLAPAQPARRMSMAPQFNSAVPLAPATPPALPASALLASFVAAPVPPVVIEPTAHSIAERKSIPSDASPSLQMMPPTPEVPAVAPILQVYDRPPTAVHAVASVESVLLINPEGPKTPAPSLFEQQADLATVRHDAPKPLLEKEVLAPRPASVAAMQPTNIPDVLTPETPQVEVHIGTIEVIVEAPRAPDSYSAAPPTRGMSLDDFLDGAGAL